MKRKHALLLTAMLCLAGGLNAEDIASEYCNTLVDPVVTDGGGASDDASDSFYMNWSTGDDGAVTITLLTSPGSAATTFRGTGMNIANFTVDGAGGKLAHAINDEKTVITLTPTETLAEGAKIVYDGYVEYKVGDEAPLNNLYPTMHFEFTYGATCSAADPVTLATPVITGVTDGKIAFTHDEAATKHVLYVYRGSSALLEYTQEDIQPGDAIGFDRPGTYTLKVQSLTESLEYLDSELSAAYEYVIEGTPEPWEETPSEYCEHMMDTGEGAAYITWNTTEDGTIIISISGVEGDPDAAFRNTGMKAADFTVNGQTGTWFASELNEAKTDITLTPLVPLIPGDRIGYNGVVEYKTALNADLWPTLSFEYTYGSNCATAPKVSLSTSTLHFMPTDGKQVFFLSGVNLTEAVTLAAPRGIAVSPDTIRPDENGVMEETAVAVLWDGGSSAGGTITISGGGLAWPQEIALTSEGFSEYCNRVITQGDLGAANHAYLTVELSEDSTQMSFLIAPYLEGQTVSWNGNSIPVGNIKVNGAAPATAPVRTAEDNDTRIRIAFAEALHDGDVVEFGAPLVWTIREGEAVINGNCFIDPAMQYTVGTGCTLEETQLAVTAVGEPTDITREGATVVIEATVGEWPVQSIRLHEDNQLVEDLVLNKEADNVYEITGLAENTEYSFAVTAIDLAGNESAPYAAKVAFTTLKTVFPSILSVGEPFNMTESSVQVRVEITPGDFPVANVRFVEDNALTADKLLPVAEDDIYTIDGLEVNTDYSFGVSVLDAEGNESEVFVNKLLVRIDRTAVAVQQTEQDAWVVYPIPARDVLHISGEPVDFVQVVDARGHLVLHTTSAEHIDVSDLPAGLYLLRIQAADGTECIRKVAIQ